LLCLCNILQTSLVAPPAVTPEPQHSFFTGDPLTPKCSRTSRSEPCAVPRGNATPGSWPRLLYATQPRRLRSRSLYAATQRQPQDNKQDAVARRHNARFPAVVMCIIEHVAFCMLSLIQTSGFYAFLEAPYFHFISLATEPYLIFIRSTAGYDALSTISPIGNAALLEGHAQSDMRTMTLLQCLIDRHIVSPRLMKPKSSQESDERVST
jgi:hypothetical protein